MRERHGGDPRRRPAVGGGGAEDQQTYPRDHGGPPTPSAPPWGGWAAQRALAAAPNGCPRARRNAVLRAHRRGRRLPRRSPAACGQRVLQRLPASRRSLVCASTPPPLATPVATIRAPNSPWRGGCTLHAKKCGFAGSQHLALPVGTASSASCVVVCNRRRRRRRVVVSENPRDKKVQLTTNAATRAPTVPQLL